MFSENFSDLFWAYVIFAGVMVFYRVTERRREPEPREQRQLADGHGSNTYDASRTSRSTLINNGEINIGTPRLPPD